MKKIFISGTFLSGKQTLLYLLDSHQEIISNFIHDQLISFIIDLNLKIKNNIKIKKKLNDRLNLDTIEIINNQNQKTKITFDDFSNSLKKSNIQHLERLSLLKIMPNYFSAIEKNYLSFDFNFEKFKENIKTEIFLSEKKIYQIEEIFDIFNKNFISNWKNVNFQKKNLRNINFATKLPNDINSIKFVLEEKFNSKIIYVDRDLLSILKSRTLDMINKRDLSLEKFDLYFNNQLRTNFIERVNFMKKEIYKIKNTDKNVYITSLEKLTKDTSNEIIKINDFLMLPKFISKIKPTYCNNDIGMKHIGKINDDEFKISNKNYIFYLFRTENFYKILNLLLKNPNYFHLFLISLYLRFKYKKN